MGENEQKDLVTLITEWWNKREASTPKDEKAFDEKLQGKIEEKPETMPEEKPPEQPPKLPFAMRPKHTRG